MLLMANFEVMLAPVLSLSFPIASRIIELADTEHINLWSAVHWLRNYKLFWLLLLLLLLLEDGPGIAAIITLTLASRFARMARSDSSCDFRLSTVPLRWCTVRSTSATCPLGDDAKVRETGQRFKETVLGLGGGVPPADVFRRFRGRDPTSEALLRHNGLLAGK